MSLIVRSFFETESCTWSHLLADSVSGEAAIVDPVWVYDAVSGQADRGFVDQLLAEIDAQGWQLRWVLETHAHADHLSCGALLRRERGARIAIGKGICSVQDTFSRVYHWPELETDGRQFDQLLAEGDELPLGTLTVRVMEAPGHTADSIVYCVEDAVFVGDTLFHPAYGTARCDFPGGNAGQLYDSIQRIYALPDKTRLFLCHDYPAEGTEPRCCSTVGESKNNNIHLRTDTTRDAFCALRNGRDAGLSLPRLILPALQVNVLAGDAPAAESNGASYLKIPFNTTVAQLLGDKDA